MIQAQQGGPQPAQSDDDRIKPHNNKVDAVAKFRDGRWSLVGNDHDDSGRVKEIDIPQGNAPCLIVIDVKPGNSGKKLHPTTPLWAVEGDCPTAPPAGGPIATAQIRDVQRINDGKLSFVDDNAGAPCAIGYAIVFDDGTAFDPIIRNGGNV